MSFEAYPFVKNTAPTYGYLNARKLGGDYRSRFTSNIGDKFWKQIRLLKTQCRLSVLQGKETLWRQQFRQVKWSAARHTGATKTYFQLNCKLRRINVMCTKFLDIVFTVFISRGWQFRAKHWHQKCKLFPEFLKGCLLIISCLYRL